MLQKFSQSNQYLILSNRPSYFQHSTGFESVSDFYLITITEFKTTFQKREPKIIKHILLSKTLTTITLDLKY